jgi:probable F420-dependent oxidoreductase
MQPFRFAVQLTGAADGQAWRQLARRTEELGYSTLFVPDHFGDQWGPIVALTVAAEATTTLRVGSLVFDNDYRHPVVLAKEMATLDLVSEGRLEFGIGAGWLRTDYEEAGLRYDRPGLRIERMVEGLHIIKDLWGRGASTRAGEHYHVSGARGMPRPRDDVGPKIIVGGGSKRVLSVAAAEADIVGFNPSLAAGVVGPEAATSSKAERYRERVAWVQEAAGDRIDQLEFQVLTFLVQVVANRGEVLANLAPMFDLTPEEAGQLPIVLIGSVEEICETLCQRRAEFGFSYWVIHEAEMEAFAPVVAKLAGT